MHYLKPGLGRYLTGLWSIVAMFIVFFYTSNLRTLLLSPGHDPEINNEIDIIKNGVKNIYVDFPHELKMQYKFTVYRTLPDLFDKVSSTLVHNIFFLLIGTALVNYFFQIQGTTDGTFSLMPNFCTETYERSSVILYQEYIWEYFINECVPLKTTDFGISRNPVLSEVSKSTII